MALTNNLKCAIMHPYLTILKLEVAFTKSRRREVESLWKPPKGVDAETKESNLLLGLHRTGAELSIYFLLLQVCRSAIKGSWIRGVPCWIQLILQAGAFTNASAFVFCEVQNNKYTYKEKRNMEQTNSRRRFKMPNTYVVIFIMLILAALLTWIIPSGSYERVINEAGTEVIVDGSFQYIDADPVGPIGIFRAIVQGFTQTADIIFFIIFAYGFVHMLMKNGTFDAMMGTLIRRTKNFNIQWVFAIVMILFGILGSTMGMAEETYGMYPVFIGLGIALGYDAIVGVSIVYIGVQTGFASATLNPFTVGVANGIAGISMSTQMLIYRIICFVIFEGVAIAYVWRYASKIKKDPTRSLLYGTPFQNMGTGKTQEEMVAVKVTKRHILCGLIFVATIAIMVWGVIAQKWYIEDRKGKPKTRLTQIIIT